MDESGDVGLPRKAECFLVVAVILLDQQGSHSVARHIKHMRKKARKKMPNELKAAEATPKQRRQLLTAIGGEDIGIVAVILDKTSIGKVRGDKEDQYRKAASLAVRQCFEQHPRLELTVDKRYTKKALRDRLEDAIKSILEGLPYEKISINHLDSRASPCLQAADYIVWAIRQKYEADNMEYYGLIRDKLISEVVVEAN